MVLYQLYFYVPEPQLEAVKAAVFAAGAGGIGNYDRCCWQVKGRGQFRPVAGANPVIGRVGDLEVLDEWRVELLVPEERLAAVVAAMKQAHPYEEVAYGILKLENS